MISSIDRQQRLEQKEQRRFERERLKNFTQSRAQAALANERMPDVLQSFISAGRVLRGLERYADARQALMTGMEIAMRTYYQARTGSLTNGHATIPKWAQRLRTMNLLDKGSYQAIVECCDLDGQADEAHVDELVALARNVVSAVLASAGPSV